MCHVIHTTATSIDKAISAPSYLKTPELNYRYISMYIDTDAVHNTSATAMVLCVVGSHVSNVRLPTCHIRMLYNMIVVLLL